MEAIKDARMNAEIAFENKQFNEALNWYQKVLDETPDDVYVLSRAGAICVPLGKFEDALKYFGRAKELDPENGDNCFNYANACFFNKDYVNAFAMYVEAERIGCSEDVTPRLYYQMAMLCSMRQDFTSSLLYFKKCEEADKEGLIALNPDLISEKLKLFMAQEDYENAETCAAQLVAIQPSAFRSYMVYYSILMAHKKLDAAQKVLDDAAQYAELTDDDAFALTLQRAALLMANGDNGDADAYAKAVTLLEGSLEGAALNDEQKCQALIALSEAYLKLEQYDKAINCLSATLSATGKAEAPIVVDTDSDAVLSDDDIERMLQEDMDRIQGKIDAGEIDDNLGMYAEIEYDEEGNERRVYNEAAFSAVNTAKDAAEEAPAQPAASVEPSVALREKIHFTLLSAFLGKEDFANAAKFANILKHSENKYYAYYGLYTSTFAERKLNGATPEVERKYAEALAYFRNKTFADPKDALASIFRARLYIEQGKSEKAKEIANLLADADRQAILDYDASYHKN